MTMDELKAALEADQEKAKLFDEALAGMTKEKAASDAEAVSLAAAAAGFELSPEEAERALAAGLEADEAELEHVAGGFILDKFGEDPEGHNNTCMATWHCWWGMLHTSSSTSETDCWSDYDCILDFHKSDCYSGTVSYCSWAWETTDD